MKLIPLDATLYRDELMTIGVQAADQYAGREQFRCVAESGIEQVLLSWAIAYYFRYEREPQSFSFRSGIFEDTPARLSYDKCEKCKATLKVPDIEAWDEEGRLHGHIEVNHYGFKAEKYPIYFSLLRIGSLPLPALLWEFPKTPYSYKDQRSRRFWDFLPRLELPPDHPHYDDEA